MSLSILFFNIFKTKHGAKNLTKDITIAYRLLSISKKKFRYARLTDSFGNLSRYSNMRQFWQTSRHINSANF